MRFVDLFDVDTLDENWPFEVDHQAVRLFKHPELGLDDVADVRASEPVFYPAKPPAHWSMVAETGGRVPTVPLAPSRSGDPRRYWPIGCYISSEHLARRYREDR